MEKKRKGRKDRRGGREERRRGRKEETLVDPDSYPSSFYIHLHCIKNEILG